MKIYTTKALIALACLHLMIGVINNCSIKESGGIPGPSAPPILYKITITGYGSVKLYWAEDTIGPAGTISYDIYMGGKKIASATTPPNSNNGTEYVYGSYVINGLNIDTLYCFQVGGRNFYPISFPKCITTWPVYTVPEFPDDIAIDATDNVWVTGYSYSHTSYVTGLSPTGSIINNYSIGGSTVNPVNIAIDAIGNFWIANISGNNVIKLSSSGSIIGYYPVGNQPACITIDASGNVWVVNVGDNTVTAMTPTGAVIGTFPVGQQQQPFAIAIDLAGDVWITNRLDNTVTAMTPTGAVIGTFPVGQQPSAIAIDPAGNVLVANNGGDTITALTPTGSVITSYTVGHSPRSIAVDSGGDMWVINGDNTLTALTLTGSVITSYTVGPSPGNMAIDANGNIWVEDVYSNFLIELVGVAKGPQFFPYKGPQWP